MFNRGLVILTDRELMILANAWVIVLNIKGAIVLSNTELIVMAKRGVTLQYESQRLGLRTEQLV
jgi:hypothetical protein